VVDAVEVAEAVAVTEAEEGTEDVAEAEEGAEAEEEEEAEAEAEADVVEARAVLAERETPTGGNEREMCTGEERGRNQTSETAPSSSNGSTSRRCSQILVIIAPSASTSSSLHTTDSALQRNYSKHVSHNLGKS
jgi:hypothetical protein